MKSRTLMIFLISLEVIALMVLSSCNNLNRVIQSTSSDERYFDCAAISNDGNLVATSWRNNAQGHVTLWSVKTGERTSELTAHEKTITTVLFSPDSKLLATASRPGNAINIWSVKKGRIIQTIDGSGGLIAIAFSQDSKMLAYSVLSQDKRIFLWDIQKNQLSKEIEHRVYELRNLLFLPDKSSIMAVGDYKVEIYSLHTGEKTREFKLDQGNARYVAIRPDGKQMAVLYHEGVKLVSLETMKTEIVLNPESSKLFRVAYSHDGKMLAGAQEGTGKVSRIKIWSTETGDLITDIDGHYEDRNASRVLDVAFTHDDKSIISVGMEKLIKVSSIDTGKVTKKINTQPFSIALPGPKTEEDEDWRHDSTITKSDTKNTTNPIVTQEQISFEQGKEFQKSPDKIISVAINSESTLAAAGTSNGEIMIVSLMNQELINTIQADKGPVNTIHFYSDSILVMAGANGTIKFINASNGSVIATIHSSSKIVNSICVNASRNILVEGGSDGNISIWSLDPKTDLSGIASTLDFKIEGHEGEVKSVCLSPDGAIIASGGTDNMVKMREVKTGKTIHTFTDHKGSVNCVKFNSKGNLLASGGDDARAMIWDISNPEKPGVYQDFNNDMSGWGINNDEESQVNHEVTDNTSAIKSISFSADDRFLTCSEGIMFRTWWVESGENHSICKGHDDTLRSLTFSRDNNYFASVGDDSNFKIWKIKRYALRDIQKSGNGYRSMAYHQNGDIVACGLENNTIEIISLSKDAVIKTLPGPMETINFSSDGRILAAGGRQSVNIWDYDSGKLIKSIDRKTERPHLGTIRLSPDGKTIALSLEETIELISISSGESIMSFPMESPAKVIRFSPNGQYMLTGGEDVLAGLWDVSTGTLIRTFGSIDGHYHHVTDAAFFSDNERVAIASWSGFTSSKVVIFNVETGSGITTLASARERFESLAVSPDSSLVAASSYIYSVNVYSVETGEKLYNLGCASTHAGGISFSPDSKLLLVPGTESTLRLWLVK